MLNSYVATIQPHPLFLIFLQPHPQLLNPSVATVQHPLFLILQQHHSVLFSIFTPHPLFSLCCYCTVQPHILFLLLLMYTLILYLLCCYSTTSSSIPYVATTLSCITLCCYYRILYYSMLLYIQPHPVLLSVATTTSCITLCCYKRIHYYSLSVLGTCATFSPTAPLVRIKKGGACRSGTNVKNNGGVAVAQKKVALICTIFEPNLA